MRFWFAMTATPRNASPITSAPVIHMDTAYEYFFGTGSTRSRVQKNTKPGAINAR
jgi:Tfp pilus tip-associated adhesin PilY1